MDFITGLHDAFVIEDADHLLQPRTDGNRNLHRFLMVADGMAGARTEPKIIFTTNLPNIGSIDDALLRPGGGVPRRFRCDRWFARRMITS